MTDDLRIVTWNANGILQHQTELQVFLDIQKIDVCLISETHLTKQNYIKLRGYSSYLTAHPENTARGGSAVLVKDNIKHYEEQKYETSKIQATAVKIMMGKYKITVAAAYCPPRNNLKMEDYQTFLTSLGDRFIVGGDFNAKNTHWGSRLTTTKGKELMKAIKKLGGECHSTGKPTYWPTDLNKIPDLLDFFISRKIPANYMKIEENYDLDSDHSPALLTLSDRIIKRESKLMLANKLTDWVGFKTEVNSNIQLNISLRTIEDIDKETEELVEIIQQAAWNNTPVLKRKTVGNNYPREIRELVTEKRKARRKWQQTRAPEDKTRLNNLTQQLTREIQTIKNESINTFLRELSADKETEYSLWRATKRLKRPIIHTPPIKKENGTLAKDNKEKAELFAQHLENTFKPNDEDGMVEFHERMPEEHEEIPPVTPKEVGRAIKEQINPKKAPGYDLITGEILTQLPRKAIVKLTYLVNAAFRLKYVPKLWKIAEVLMILKPGKPPNEVSSYRPISLLPVISKLFERLLLQRIKPIIEQKNLIPNHQFGFRNKHSTVEQVHRIVERIEQALEERKICTAVFLDVAQAFDKVWHEGLEYKLKKLLPKQYSEILISYTRGRIFRVKYEEEYSEVKSINAGVPQGSVLGPILYLLYTCDIPQSKSTTIATFADDTAILAIGDSFEEAADKVQIAIRSVSDWTKQWNIRLNEQKSTHINFTNKDNRRVILYINERRVPFVNNAKYLGMNLDVKLNWKTHIKKKRRARH
jgi:hypothetical protein